MGPIDTRSRPPGCRAPLGQGPLQHRRRPWRRRRKAARRGTAGALAARGVVGPLVRERECPLAPQRALGRRRGPQHPHGAMCNTAGWPPRWARHPRRRLAFLQESRRLDAHHGLGSPQRRDDLRAQSVAESHGIPRCPSQQMLHARGRGIAMPCGQWPAIFALHGAAQASARGPSAAPRGTAGNAWQYMSCHLGPPERPFPYRRQRSGGWRCAPLLPQLHGSTLHKLCGTIRA
jgi:hypothetical protein